MHRKEREKMVDSQATAGACVLLLAALYLCFLWRTETVLDALESKQKFRFQSLLLQRPKQQQQQRAPKEAVDWYVRAGRRRATAKAVASIKGVLPGHHHHEDRYILFDHFLGGQGLGNMMAGLLAAHLLGDEFGRIVCIRDWEEFRQVFDPIRSDFVEKCPSVLEKMPQETSENHIQLINYQPPPNECRLKLKLENPDLPVIYMTGNTYPRWPVVPDRYFATLYQPSKALAEILPYDTPPATVVHLRESDVQDPNMRTGLDRASLRALGELLPRNNTFLVTNKVAWFEKFEKKYGWSHSPWYKVRHSAGDMGRNWGELEQGEEDLNYRKKYDEKTLQNLQMFSDWYTIAMAKTVYHTHSDFSISAVHWMNIQDAHSIVGADDKGKLQTTAESWRVDGETELLSRRSLKANGTAQLRLCEEDDKPKFLRGKEWSRE
jgi:hypothetical protein